MKYRKPITLLQKHISFTSFAFDRVKGFPVFVICYLIDCQSMCAKPCWNWLMPYQYIFIRSQRTSFWTHCMESFPIDTCFKRFSLMRFFWEVCNFFIRKSAYWRKSLKWRCELWKTFLLHIHGYFWYRLKAHLKFSDIDRNLENFLWVSII